MIVDPVNFLHSLLLQVASSASLVYAATATTDAPRQLWHSQADETQPTLCAPVYTVAAIYPGSVQINEAMQEMAVQFVTTGVEVAALRQAWAVRDALCDSAGTPRTQWTFASKVFPGTVDDGGGGWRVLGVDIRQRPGKVGKDDQGRSQISFNADISFSR